MLLVGYSAVKQKRLETPETSSNVGFQTCATTSRGVSRRRGSHATWPFFVLFGGVPNEYASQGFLQPRAAGNHLRVNSREQSGSTLGADPRDISLAVRANLANVAQSGFHVSGPGKHHIHATAPKCGTVRVFGAKLARRARRWAHESGKGKCQSWAECSFLGK